MLVLLKTLLLIGKLFVVLEIRDNITLSSSAYLSMVICI